MKKYTPGLDIPADIGRWAVDLVDLLVKQKEVEPQNIIVNLSAREDGYASQLAALKGDHGARRNAV